MEITVEQSVSLESHLLANQLSEMAELAKAAVASTQDGFMGGPFLHSEGNAAFARAADGSGEFLLWIQARTEPMLLAEHFPRLAPYSPWGIIDTESLPFPHLAAVAIDQADWDYVYFSTADAAKQTALLSTAGWPGLTAARLTAFRRLSGAAGWQGGLYYNGRCALPWNDYVPNASAWAPAILTTELAVDGYVAQQGLVPELKLRVPLLNKDKPFGEGPVKNASLALEFSSALASPEPLPGELQDRYGVDRRIGLIGTLSIGNAAEVTATGSWPLDGDEVLLEFAFEVSALSSWFDVNNIQGVTAPDGLTAGVALAVSKDRGTLDKVGLQFALTNWKIGPADFNITLNKVEFEANIYSPASAKMTLARFAADATFAAGGTGSGGAQLRCTGTYPDGEYYFGLAEGATVPLHDLITAIGGGDAGSLENLAITELSGRYNASSGYRAFDLAIANGEASALETGDLGFHLEDINLGIYGSLAIVFKLSAAFRYTFKKATGSALHFTGSAEYNGGWLFSLNYAGGVSLKDIATEFGIQHVPNELGAFAFNELDFIADSGTEAKYFHGKGTIHFEGEDTELALQVNRTKAGETMSTTFAGSLKTKIGGSNAELLIDSTSGESSELDVKLHFTVAGVTVELEAKTDGSGDGSLGQMHFTGSALLSQPLHISELLEELLTYGDVALPDGFIPALDLNGLYVSYDGKTRQIDLIALSTVASEEVRFFFQYQLANGQYALGIETTVDKLSGIPLIGSELNEVKLLDIGFIYISGEGEVVLPTLLRAAGEARTMDLPGATQKDFVQGFNLKGELKLPLMEKPLALRRPVAQAPAATAAAKKTGKTPTSSAAGGLPAAAPAQTPAVQSPSLMTTRTRPLAAGAVEKWFELDAKIGPLHISRVGLSYAGGKLYLLIGLDLTLAGLVFSADGLGLGFTPQSLLAGHIEQPSFKLAGLGLSYSSGPVQISGAFLHGTQPVMDPDGNPKKDEQGQAVLVDVYSGGAVVKMENFTITGLGSYATYQSEPSLFVYALYEGVLGGPSFFFVTGLSIGFGYNRKVNVPAFDHVARFPLVAMALGTGPAEDKTVAGLLQRLDTVDDTTGKRPIDIAMGEYWLAVGVKFTTFEIVHGYLLLIGEFGHHLQFTVLGVAELTLPMPPEGPALSDDLKLVYLKMQMAAVLIPSEGYFGVAGSLTPDSYVLTKDCHITGGFAYSMWYDSPDAEKNGQFVMTAGGFHPAFKAPAYFPQVPRLGYVWQVSDMVSIKGQSYYALTSSCGMAGTSLELLFESGDIKAWFIAKADMLVTWHPLSFVAEVYIEIGVSVRLNLLFCHKTVSVSISAGLTLWGPPLGGRVEVHVVVVTLTIGFGADNHNDKNLVPLPWQSTSGADSFKALLPAPKDVCKILAGSGVTQPKPTSDIWVVRGGTFSFTAQSAIPISKLKNNFHVELAEADKQKLSKLNVRPMNLTGIDSIYTVTITENGAAKTEAIAWTIEPVFSNVAAALWGEPLTEGSDKHFVQSPSTPSNDVVERLIGCRVKAPAPQSGNSFGIVALKQLEFERVADGALALGSANMPFDYRLAGYTPVPKPSLAAPNASTPPPVVAASSAKRNKLFAALSYQDLYNGTNDNLQKLTADYAGLFKDDPLLYSVPV